MASAKRFSASTPGPTLRRGFCGTSGSALPIDLGIRLNQWTEQIMQEYCCYFLNGRGHILFPANIGAEGLEAAKQHCFAILEECVSSLPEPPRGIEIWEEDIMLFRS
jgi:hypothetical protein